MFCKILHRKISIQILMTGVFALLSTYMISQKVWTLDDCVAYALKHNLQLNGFKLDVASNRETYRQSYRDLLPNLNGFSDYNIQFGRSVDPNDNSISNTEFFTNRYLIESTLDLFQGFQKQNAIKASKFIYKAAKEETLQQKYLLAFRVMQAFYDIRFFKGSLRIAEEQLAISQSNYNLVKKQIELGLMAGADLYEAESILLTDQLEVTTARNQLVAAKLALTQEMNLEGTTDIMIVNEEGEKLVGIEESKAQSSDSIYDKAKDFIPIVKARELRVKAAKKQLSVERGKLYPTLSLFGQYGTGYFETIRDSLDVTVPFRDQFRDNTFQVIGIALNIPISNGWSARSRVKQQKIAQARAENDLKVQQQELFQTIQSLVQEYNALQIELEQTIKNAASQDQSFRIAQKRYERGLINAIELFTAKNLFAIAQNQSLRVRLQVEINQSTLNFYKGLPVFDIQ